MPKLHSCRLLVLAVLTAVFLILPLNSAQALTQRDWMIVLVDGLGRSFGLPDSPQPDDYLNILQGKRNLRFEAENVHSEDDEVSTLSFLNYGPFSGSGWLLGTSRPTAVHLRFVLPLDGRYRLSVAVHLPGHTLKVGAQGFTADGDAQKFSKVEVGEVALTAGHQEIIVTLPPGGALDYFELAAPNLPPIAPDGGWQPNVALTWDALAVTAVQALHLEKELPLTERSLAVEAETLSETGGAQVVEDAHLGRPSGGRWLRTAAQAAKVGVPLEIAQGGFYDIDLAVMGAGIDLLINGQQSLAIEGKPYLAAVTTPPVFLPKGPNHLEITLPPGGGLDRIAAKARQSDLTALTAALGLTLAGDAPTSADLDRLTARLSSAAR
ncbi:MAG: hypothetical protein NDI73_02905 [Desulfuromonadales bacterium]|nr:hypothetical protein [Desulfuromonadales bacterium]